MLAELYAAIQAFNEDVVGVPSSGTDNQALLKDGATNYVTKWGNVWLKSELTVESGTWTPVLYGTTTAGNHTYATQYGEYVRIDKLVMCQMSIGLSAKGTIDGSLRVSGLPHAADATATAAAFGVNTTNVTRTDIREVLAYPLAGQSYLSMRIHYATSNVLVDGALAASHIANDTFFRASFCYKMD